MLRGYAGYVRLREHAVGGQPASAGTAEEGADIELVPGEELQVGVVLGRRSGGCNCGCVTVGV